jgi:chemotaxis protein histidine kinase CheA
MAMTPSELPKSFKEELDVLKKNYAQTLPEEIHLLEELWEKGDLKGLHLRLHTLAGSAASFGFGSVGAVARKMELCLVAALKQKTPLSNEQKSILKQGLKELQRGV